MTAGRLVRRLLVALLVAAFVVICLRLGWWQWRRFGLTGSVQNLGYTFQWPTFALFAVLMWWRLSRLEAQRRQEQARAPEAAEPTNPAVHTSPNKPTGPAEHTDPNEPTGPAEPHSPAKPAGGTGPTEPTSPTEHTGRNTGPTERISLAGPAERARPAQPTAPVGRTGPAAAEPAGTPDDLDDELAAYNRYLAQLHAKESHRANRRTN
jgi:DNA-binding transcriptional regulator of glucitol operon